MANPRNYNETDRRRRSNQGGAYGQDEEPRYNYEEPDPYAFGGPGQDPVPFERGDFRPQREPGGPYGPPSFGPLATGMGAYPVFPGGYPRSRYEYAYDRAGNARPEPHHGHHHDRGFFDKAGDEVQSWFGDDDAARRRERDHREGEHRGRGPKGYARSDTRIHEDVCDRLYDDSWVDASQVEVSVDKGEVTLSGHVHSKGDKRRVEDLADDISGVGHVQNNLRVITHAHDDKSSGTNSNGSAH